MTSSTVQRLSIVVDGKTVSVVAQKIGRNVWFHYAGRVFCVEPESLKSERNPRPRSGSKSKGGDVVAPMPGKIVKVLTHEKMHVTDRQPLLVMEAMKMEYTLESTGPGLVEKIHCQVGDQVRMGQILVNIVLQESPGSAGANGIHQ